MARDAIDDQANSKYAQNAQGAVTWGMLMVLCATPALLRLPLHLAIDDAVGLQ
jgi:hypothetical protein